MYTVKQLCNMVCVQGEALVTVLFICNLLSSCSCKQRPTSHWRLAAYILMHTCMLLEMIAALGVKFPLVARIRLNSGRW